MQGKEQGNLGIIGITLAILVVAFTASISWYIWHSGQVARQAYDDAVSQAKAVAMTKYTDTAKVFTLTYPSAWKLSYSEPCCEAVSPDWTKESRPFTLIPDTAPHGALGAQVAPMSRQDALAAVAKSRADTFHTVRQLKLDGREAYYDRLTFAGPSAAEKYTDDTYYIINGDTALLLTFRERYYHSYPATQWDDGKDAAAFQGIVTSVQFL